MGIIETSLPGPDRRKAAEDEHFTKIIIYGLYIVYHIIIVFHGIPPEEQFPGFPGLMGKSDLNDRKII